MDINWNSGIILQDNKNPKKKMHRSYSDSVLICKFNKFVLSVSGNFYINQNNNYTAESWYSGNINFSSMNRKAGGTKTTKSNSNLYKQDKCEDTNTAKSNSYLYKQDTCGDTNTAKSNSNLHKKDKCTNLFDGANTNFLQSDLTKTNKCSKEKQKTENGMTKLISKKDVKVNNIKRVVPKSVLSTRQKNTYVKQLKTPVNTPELLPPQEQLEDISSRDNSLVLKMEEGTLHASCSYPSMLHLQQTDPHDNVHVISEELHAWHAKHRKSDQVWNMLEKVKTVLFKIYYAED